MSVLSKNQDNISKSKFKCYFINNLVLLYAIDTVVSIKQEENIYFS